MDNIKIHQFDPVIYPVKIWVVYKPTKEFIINEFENCDDRQLVENFYCDGAAAAVTPGIVRLKKNRKRGIIVGIYEKLDVNYIAHESCHVVGEIYNYLGVKFATIEDEPNAYLTGWVASCIDEVNKLID